jgi:hypothetical protein
VALIAWSLVADARERVAPTPLGPTKAPQRPMALAPVNRVPATDPKMWN